MSIVPKLLWSMNVSQYQKSCEASVFDDGKTAILMRLEREMSVDADNNLMMKCQA